MSKTATLDLTCNAYSVHVEVKRTRIPCKKAIWEGDRIIGQREFMVPMDQSTVTLTHDKGDILIFRQTTMGSRTSMTRGTNMVRPTIRNKAATGPADIETDTKPLSMKPEQAMASVARMCGLTLTEVQRLFNVDMILALDAAQVQEVA